jgi:hypothetical protein
MDKTIKTWPENSFGMFRWIFFSRRLIFDCVDIWGTSQRGRCNSDRDRAVVNRSFLPSTVLWVSDLLPIANSNG